MKIITLSPCLMQENTRKANSTALNQLYDTFKFDEYVVYDQCFEETDYHPGFKYIGHAKQKMGWVASRNALLEYFYNSDADYAFWIDANSTVTKTCWNDVTTLIDSIQKGKLNQCDAIFATLGIWVSQDRIQAKSAPDFMQNIHLIPARNDKSYNWMHGLIIKNFKKYYGQEFMIDPRCNMLEGTPEDVFFARLLRKYAACYVAPTITISKPSNKASTWAHNLNNYDYPPVLFDTDRKSVV